ncbi:MAG: tRNA (adenosine(37)-N6)-dimethylallyltransferase MiaA [Leeuwenhoekiella sp.]
MNNFLIVVVGPTAIGKTSLAIALAKHYGTEIISADSRQFYKEMKIGTAVPSEEELNQAKHNFIQHISVNESYSVGHFEEDALNCLDKIFQNNSTAIMVGGSGLYVKAVLEGLDHLPKVDDTTRLELQQKMNEEGLDALTAMLKIRDPKQYDKIDLSNPQRVIRALEVCVYTGKPYSEFLNKDKPKRNFNYVKVGLTADRDIIYDRINKRVELMFEKGLKNEVKNLVDKRHLNALNTVGYKELFTHFEGKLTEKEAISEIQKNTRRFAKRQLTWYRKDESIHWFDYDYDLNEIINTVDNTIQ